jgi:hypothetical protein
MSTDNDGKYASCSLAFLNRDNGEINERKFLCYPLTRIELFEIRDGVMQPVKIFEASANMQWQEMPLPPPLTEEELTQRRADVEKVRREFFS